MERSSPSSSFEMETFNSAVFELLAGWQWVRRLALWIQWALLMLRWHSRCWLCGFWLSSHVMWSFDVSSGTLNLNQNAQLDLIKRFDWPKVNLFSDVWISDKPESCQMFQFYSDWTFEHPLSSPVSLASTVILPSLNIITTLYADLTIQLQRTLSTETF